MQIQELLYLKQDTMQCLMFSLRMYTAKCVNWFATDHQ